MRYALLPVAAFAFFVACERMPSADIAWQRDFEKLGTGSSPKCADLNRDGVPDVVIGAGENETEESDRAVLALDGRDGAVLWTVAAKDQIVGSPVFLDITNDSIPEVFIGGRNAQYMCIDGAHGNVLWRFGVSDADPVLSCCFRYNFFNAQVIADADHDQHPDLLLSNGGNPKAHPHTTELRVPGVLAVLSSRDGHILALDTMPDGNEIYMTPVIHDFQNAGAPEIIFGTGGETLGGNLFRVPLKDLLNSDISSAWRLTSGEGYGFIAPPTLADVNADGICDIIANWFGGKMVAIDGKTNALLWERKVPGTETYSTAVPGFFNDDNIPDFFSIYNKGAWPNNKGSVQLLINGKNGKVLLSDSLGCMGYSSGVTFDTNGDGFDEVLFSVNEYLCDPPAYMGEDIVNGRHSLRLLNFHDKQLLTLGEVTTAKNISSTPWVGDLDNDLMLDVVYCIQRNQLQVDRYSGLTLVRLKTNMLMAHWPAWNSYLGERSNGIFIGRRSSGN